MIAKRPLSSVWMRQRITRGLTILEIVVILIVIAILIALLMPAMQGPRVGGTRPIQCKNQLKLIGLALHNYHDVYGTFPPAFTVDADGKPLHSWRTLILPFIDNAALYNRLDLTQPWGDPANADLLSATIPFYHCPSSQGDAAHTNYLAVVVPGSAFDPRKSRSLQEITDGTNNTLLVIEVPAEQAVPWYTPQDADETVLQGFGPKSKESHEGGRYALFSDGHVRFLSQNIAPETFQSLITAAAGDKVGEF